VTVTYKYQATAEELTSVQYECNYRIEAWANNGDLSVELYHLVKWILLSNRDKIAMDLGIYRQKLGGSDFQPSINFYPEFVYRRGVTFWCQCTASVIAAKDVPFIQKVEEVDADLWIRQNITINRGEN
jgi:hypothetical protein